MWSVDSRDWVLKNESRIVNTVCESALTSQFGAIILFHDFINDTVDALPKIIESIKASGKKIVGIGDCIGQ